MKSIKLHQLLFSASTPCLSIYANDSDGLAGLESKILQRLQGELAVKVEQSLPQMHECLRAKNLPHGFFLSPAVQGFLPLDHSINDHFRLGESFALHPVLEEFFPNPEYALVVLDEGSVRLYVGDSRQVEFLEQFETLVAHAPARTFMGASSFVSHRQQQGLKALAMKLLQLPRLAHLPVIVAGEEMLVSKFHSLFDHSFGTIPWVAPHTVSLTCPQLVQEVRAIKPQVVEVYAHHFGERLKRLVRSRRLLTSQERISAAIGESRVMRLLVSETARPLHIPEVEAIIHDTIQSGGKIQFLPAHFFPAGIQVMGLLKGDGRAAASIFGVDTLAG